MLTSPDFLRLRSTHDQVRLAVKLQERVLWRISLMTPAALFLEATSELIQVMRDRVRAGPPPAVPATPQAATTFVDERRIAELAAIKGSRYDLQKLVSLCEELNKTYRGECYFSVAMLTRAILDHVPPIFAASIFAEVANNYSGARSFRRSMQNLERSSRNISDAHLHLQIRGRKFFQHLPK